MSANEELIRQGYKAFNEADAATLSGLLAEDVVHVVPGNNQISGEHKGRDAVLAMYGKIAELTAGNYSADLESVEETSPGTVVARHHSTGERAGKVLDVENTLTFTIVNGNITRIREESSDQAAEDAFFA